MKKKKKVIDLIFIFLKGLAMGSADIIPGVSGGTIALITGIYERFIFALKSINLHFIYYFIISIKDRDNLKRAKESFLSIDFALLIPLILGILCAFLTLANIVGFFLKTNPTQTFSFFFGLIIASAFYVYYTHRSLFYKNSLIFLFLGAILGFFIVGFESIQLDHSLMMIFFSGIISLCAMILPGLSGAFILFILGQYNFLLSVLRELTLLNFSMMIYVVAYCIGGIIGLLGFSRVLSYLFSKYKSATIAFIIGLMVGALRKPGQQIISDTTNFELTLITLIAGILVVILFSAFELKKKSIIK